ncbi:hypothetical protein K7432_001030 [Basidiobolus ranarum]|uniref:Uncharacterized protein n=1 Tax=Basidiobolus ranarum TaxID=34480 RepID=A0ABR2WAB0_9FUNG
MRNIPDQHLRKKSSLKKRLSSLFQNGDTKGLIVKPIDSPEHPINSTPTSCEESNTLEISADDTKMSYFSRNPILRFIKGISKPRNPSKDAYEIDEEEGADLPQLCDITFQQTEFLFRSEFSPLKQVYVDSMKKLQNSKMRPLHQLLLIHQTILKVNTTTFATGVHPLLLQRRLSERTILPKTVNRTSTQSGRHPLASSLKANSIPPPPPYYNDTFEIREMQPPMYHEQSIREDRADSLICNRTVQQMC